MIRTSSTAAFVASILICLPCCIGCRDSAAQQQTDLQVAIVGTWKHVREEGKPVTPKSDESGEIEFRSDGTMTSEDVSEFKFGEVVESRSVTPVEGRYRIIDGRTVEIVGQFMNRERTFTQEVVVEGDHLTLKREFGGVSEFDRAK